MAHPGRCKAIASGRLKTDKVDARTLAHLLRTDLLPQAWIAPSEIRDLRQLLRARVALVRLRVSLQARIHAVLADRGVLVDRPLWKTPGRLWLSSLELPAPQRMLIDRFSALIDQINEQIRALEGELADRARPDPRIKALMELPGIGSFTALLLVAEIGDIARFPTARKLCSWAGLTPVVRNSAATVRHGHITKEGSAWVRWALVESAQIAKSREPFSRPYAQISRRRGKNIATVAIARKLLARCFYVLKGVNDASTLLEEVSVSDELEV
jgi:transposase